MKRAGQSSESIELAFFLALSGGLMDAYSYLGRGHVFANAQTGNILLASVNIADGNWQATTGYIVPVLSFACGVALAQVLRIFSKEKRLHWRQLVLLAQIALLVFVACMPAAVNLAANSLTSLACGMQVQAFRKIHGHGFATTMCIGNLRNGTHALVDFAHERKLRHLETALLYYGTIIAFALGAILGSRALPYLGLHAILLSPLLLSIALLIMFVNREERASNGARGA